MSLADLLSEIAREAESTRAPDLPDSVIVALLRDAELQLRTPETFKPGDVLLHRWPERSGIKGASQPVVFECYIEPIPGHQGVSGAGLFSHTSAMVVDCRIMTLGEGKIIPFLADSRTYRLHPDFPRDPIN